MSKITLVSVGNDLGRPATSTIDDGRFGSCSKFRLDGADNCLAVEKLR